MGNIVLTIYYQKTTNKNKQLLIFKTSIMKVKTIITTLLVATIGLFTIFSFTSKEPISQDLTSYDQSFYDDISNVESQFSFNLTLENDKCGGDKKAKKCGGDKKADEGKDTKCGTGKCG